MGNPKINAQQAFLDKALTREHHPTSIRMLLGWLKEWQVSTLEPFLMLEKRLGLHHGKCKEVATGVASAETIRIIGTALEKTPDEIEFVINRRIYERAQPIIRHRGRVDPPPQSAEFLREFASRNPASASIDIIR